MMLLLSRILQIWGLITRKKDELIKSWLNVPSIVNDKMDRR
jgi:hypothetical protein